MKHNRCLFTDFLRALGVCFVYKSTRRKYEEHPHKGNMYGLSSLLSDYKVANTGLLIDKQDLLQLKPC